MDLSIRRFGRPSREMVGVVQQARSSVPSKACWMLCRPLGQEAVRTASVYRVLSDRLAREGCDVLRFDYHGTGDSPGEEEDQSLEAWVEDTLAAHEQLASRPGLPLHWFGMGLGATLALNAAQRAVSPPSHLVLWEPVLAGKTYIDSLMQAHCAELSREFGKPWPRLLRTGQVVEPRLPGDLLGFEFGGRLTSELHQLGGQSLRPVLERGIQVTCAIHAEQREWLGGVDEHPSLKTVSPETRTNWMSSQAMGTAIVPPDLPRLLLSTLQ